MGTSPLCPPPGGDCHILCPSPPAVTVPHYVTSPGVTVTYYVPADRVREKDFRDAVIYLNGYTNLTDGADYKNTSMTILANHVPKKFLKNHAGNIENPSAGVWKIRYGLFSIYFVDINKTERRELTRRFSVILRKRKLLRKVCPDKNQYRKKYSPSAGIYVLQCGKF